MRHGKLIPVKVPWMVSPSTPCLRLLATEQVEAGGGALLDFVAFYKCNENKQNCAPHTGITIVASPPPFQAEASPGRAVYRLVRAKFTNSLWTRMLPSHSDSQAVDESKYDWSCVPGSWSPEEDMFEYLARKREQWLETGICLDPSFYEVVDSSWLRESGAADDQYNNWKHYLVLGHDAYIEVIAEGVQFEEGQSLVE